MEQSTRGHGAKASQIARGFEQFWAAYPRRVGKLAALREWNRLKPDPALLELMLAEIRRQQRTRQWREGYIPHPRTWLHQGRWMDEPDQPASYVWECPHDPRCGSASQCDVQQRIARGKSA